LHEIMYTNDILEAPIFLFGLTVFVSA